MLFRLPFYFPFSPSNASHPLWRACVCVTSGLTSARCPASRFSSSFGQGAPTSRHCSPPLLCVINIPRFTLSDPVRTLGTPLPAPTSDPPSLFLTFPLSLLSTLTHATRARSCFASPSADPRHTNALVNQSSSPPPPPLLPLPLSLPSAPAVPHSLRLLSLPHNRRPTTRSLSLSSPSPPRPLFFLCPARRARAPPSPPVILLSSTPGCRAPRRLPPPCTTPRSRTPSALPAGPPPSAPPSLALTGIGTHATTHCAGLPFSHLPLSLIFPTGPTHFAELPSLFQLLLSAPLSLSPSWTASLSSSFYVPHQRPPSPGPAAHLVSHHPPFCSGVSLSPSHLFRSGHAKRRASPFSHLSSSAPPFTASSSHPCRRRHCSLVVLRRQRTAPLSLLLTPSLSVHRVSFFTPATLRRASSHVCP